MFCWLRSVSSSEPQAKYVLSSSLMFRILAICAALVEDTKQHRLVSYMSKCLVLQLCVSFAPSARLRTRFALT